MKEVKESSQRWKRIKRKLCPTNQGGENDKKKRGVIIFKTLSKVTDKRSLKLRVGNSRISLAKLVLGRSLVLRWKEVDDRGERKM